MRGEATFMTSSSSRLDSVGGGTCTSGRPSRRSTSAVVCAAHSAFALHAKASSLYAEPSNNPALAQLSALSAKMYAVILKALVDMRGKRVMRRTWRRRGRHARGGPCAASASAGTRAG